MTHPGTHLTLHLLLKIIIGIPLRYQLEENVFFFCQEDQHTGSCIMLTDYTRLCMLDGRIHGYSPMNQLCGSISTHQQNLFITEQAVTNLSLLSILAALHSQLVQQLDVKQ